MFVESESLTNEFDDQPNWSKKSISAINEDAKTDQLVRITQKIFSNDAQKKDQLKRNTNLKEIKSFLEKQTSNSTSTCAPVVSNYLKNFVKFFESSEGHGQQLQKFRVELEIVKFIVEKFQSFVPLHRAALMKIILRELSFICSFECSNYRKYIIDLFVKISIAGKWSFQNSQTFKTHYENLFISFLNSVYFLAYKYEFYQRSNYPETLEEHQNNEGLNLIATKDELLEFSKDQPSKFCTVLMEILKSLVAEKILYNASFPITLAVNFSAKVLQDIKFDSPIGNSNSQSCLSSLQLEVTDFLKLICLRFGSASIVFMKPVVTIVGDYLKRVASFLVLRLGEKLMTEDFGMLFSGILSLAECVIRNVTKYAFNSTDLGQVLVSLSFSVQRFSHQELPINANGSAEEMINNLSLTGGSKKSRKRKREQMAKLASTNGNGAKENSEVKAKVYCDMLTSAINFCACLFGNCSHLFAPEVLHKSMLCFVSISLTAFSGTQTDFSRATVKYTNMEYFKNEQVLLALLSCVEALIIRPNPKCSPPLSIVSEILKLASNDERPQVSEKAQRLQAMTEMVVKPNMIQVFPSIALEYEPKTEVETSAIQTENQVTQVNASSQTLEATTVAQADPESFVKRTKRMRSKVVQTDEKFSCFDGELNFVEKEVTSGTQNDVKLDCDDDEDNFVDICEQFVPEIV